MWTCTVQSVFKGQLYLYAHFYINLFFSWGYLCHWFMVLLLYDEWKLWRSFSIMEEVGWEGRWLSCGGSKFDEFMQLQQEMVWRELEPQAGSKPLGEWMEKWELFWGKSWKLGWSGCKDVCVSHKEAEMDTETWGPAYLSEPWPQRAPDREITQKEKKMGVE